MASTSPLSSARALLRDHAERPCERRLRATRAVELAELLQALSERHQQHADRARARMLGRMLDDRAGQQFTTELSDRLFRSRDDARALDELSALLARQGVPRFMQLHERAALFGVSLLAPLHPPGLAAAVRARVRGEARAVLLDAEERALSRYLDARHREGVRVNLNKLGEALLGEEEAERRVSSYVALAARGGLDALSVKVSSIGSQLDLLAFEDTVEVLAARLRRIYAATLDAHEPTLVMLDMEAYQHVELTFAVWSRALDDPALDRVRTGIVLQAYLPDSDQLLTRVQALARARVERGGLPLRIRLVKGANLAHERVESQRSGLSLPVFEHKRAVDAHYKHLLERALTADSLETLAVGVASHNLFDLSYALLLRAESEAGERVELELLEGMADPVRRALTELGVSVLVYAPVCRDDELNTGIAYLVRRLDENTGRDNYLRSSFHMTRERFELERHRFLQSVAQVDRLELTPRRARDVGFDRTRRRLRKLQHQGAFRGEPDSDFSSPSNRAWIRQALTRAHDAQHALVCSRIDGQHVRVGELVDGVDPSRPGHVPYQLGLADAAWMTRAVDVAVQDPDGFSRRSVEERSRLLARCADVLREARAELIAAMVLDGGKRVVEADAEVSEAIDFAEYYRSSFSALLRNEAVQATPHGVVLVTPPWNFPLAIPTGGVLAALMAGNRVLFKPALETPLVGALLARLLVRAGVPERALQLLICDDEAASALVRDARVHDLILTGATSTARLFQELRPGLRLLAETGGKNALIVSAMSDRELAVASAVQSAFGHAGQKCSAASLLICEREVYEDAHFRRTLRDAVQSLPVGSAWDARSFVTPLIRPPEGALLRALTTLEPGESWLVEPRITPDNPRLVTPGVKLGVRPGSFTHRTELFGPLLGVMSADSLPQAIELANATGYGLTAGLASLDEREQAYFVAHMRAGNLYVNRTTTGAIVRRQPFGGMGKSGFGPGAKAGGPNYVAQLCTLGERGPLVHDASVPLPTRLARRLRVLEAELSPAARTLLRARLQDYVRARDRHFACEHDPEQLLGQHNRFRYRPCSGVLIRVEADAQPVDVAASLLAAELVDCKPVLSVDPRARVPQDATVLGHPLWIESAASLLARTPAASRIRVLGARTEELDALNAASGAHIADAPVLGLGRFELLHYVSEQSISIDYHRYGHVPERDGEGVRRR